MSDETIKLYRAMGASEFEEVMITKQFSLLKNKAEVKYFGFDFEETLQFANKAFNVDLVAVVEVSISETILDEIGDFTQVDPYLFKCGTVEIQPQRLDEFNRAIINIIHKI